MIQQNVTIIIDITIISFHGVMKNVPKYKLSSFKRSKNIQKEELGRPDCTNNKFF